MTSVTIDVAFAGRLVIAGRGKMPSVSFTVVLLLFFLVLDRHVPQSPVNLFSFSESHRDLSRIARKTICALAMHSEEGNLIVRVWGHEHIMRN